MRDVYVPAERFHEITDEQALADVDALLGRAEEQHSALLRYRFASGWQADWKAEVGHWLHTASRLGFADPLWTRAVGRYMTGMVELGKPHPNDDRHRVFVQELAPAMMVHYLTGLGWAFEAWEPARAREPGRPALDVDVGLMTPDGQAVDVQVKASDKPGYVVAHRRVDGENDQHVIAGLHKAAMQLPAGGSCANMIVASPQRNAPLSGEPGSVVVDLIGGGTNMDDGGPCLLPRADWGAFYQRAWRHVSAVMLLDLVRGLDRRSYGAAVLLNPWAKVKADPSWFPAGRVCIIEDGVVRWLGGGPPDEDLPEGTKLIDQLPWYP